MAILLGLLFECQPCLVAQQNETKDLLISSLNVPCFHELKVGDKVPEVPLTMLEQSDQKVWLSDFKGKLVILDFWATWCTACIEKFPKLDSLQKKFGNKIQILLVNSVNTGDSEGKIRDFFSKRKDLISPTFQLPLVILDTIAQVLFPHREVPHYAWIGKDGRVSAITSTEQVTNNNIESVLDKGMGLPVKRDYFPNQLLDLPLDRVLVDENMPYYCLFKKGRIDGLKSLNYPRSEPVKKGYLNLSNDRGISLINLPLIEMYLTALRYNQVFWSSFTDKKFILDLEDSSGLIFDPSRFDRNEWEKRNLYTFDMVVPRNEIGSLHSIILEELNHYSGYCGKFEKRNIKCLSLVRTSSDDKIKTKGEISEFKLYMEYDKRYIQNMPLKRLVSWLNSQSCVKLILLDETNYSSRVDIDLSVDLNDFIAIKKALNKYDLDLKEVEREIEVFVLSQKGKN